MPVLTLMTPSPAIDPNGLRICASGFREYDARWRYPEDINAGGFFRLGLCIGTQMHGEGTRPAIIVGHDFRACSQTVADALVDGLVAAGIAVHDIGLCLSPMAYFAQVHLGVPAVAMVTASHNPNGWTGVKVGFAPATTHGLDLMQALKHLVAADGGVPRPGGSVRSVSGVRAAYLADAAGGFRLTRPLRIVCATGNGTAGAFAPDLLSVIGAEVIARHTDLDWDFPHYNPNPESLTMLHDMAAAVKETGADLALGFDGDGDRCGVVDDTGTEVFADRMGVLLARDCARRFPNVRFIVDVKSTALYRTDPVLRAAGAEVEYWKTGHSHIKARLRETGALAAFERSGHCFFAPPLGHGYDCGLRTAVAICRMMDQEQGRRLSEISADLPAVWATPTLSPPCADGAKYQVVDRITAQIGAMMRAGSEFGAGRIAAISTVNGVRLTLADGSWALVRASSNTPNLVVVCESLRSAEHRDRMVRDIETLLSLEPQVGV